MKVIQNRKFDLHQKKWSHHQQAEKMNHLLLIVTFSQNQSECEKRKFVQKDPRLFGKLDGRNIPLAAARECT